MYRCLILLISWFAAAAMAAPAWTWVDANGQRHFSDRPVPGATQIELPDSQVFTGTRTSRSATQSSSETVPADEPQVPQDYTAFNILSPAHQETVWNIGGNLTVQLEIAPSLQAGHRLDAVLDGQRVEIGARGGQLTVPEVFRGLHTVEAIIIDAVGREVLRSRGVTVMVQQTSVLNPNNPNN